MPRKPRALLAPLEPRQYAPTATRPVRAKARHLALDSEIQPHSHPWAQVAITVSGVARITTVHSTCLVPAWRAVWIPPAVEHTVTAVETAELRTLYIHASTPMPEPGASPAQQAAWQRQRVLEVTPLLREVALQMDVTMDIQGPPKAELLARESLLGQVALDELRRAAPLRLGIELPQDKRLRALCVAVLEAPTRHSTLRAWAAESGASERTLARLFRLELGTSFGPWREQVLLAQALALAAQGKPMGLIADALGYASASAFSAMVRRAVGQPPSRFFALKPDSAAGHAAAAKIRR